MNRLILAAMLWGMAAMSAWGAAGARLDSVYAVLDREIARSDGYVAARRARIARLRTVEARTRKPRELLGLADALAQEYAPYRSDSAIHYLQRCIGLAGQLADGARLTEYRARLACFCARTGMYDEARGFLAAADTNVADRRALGEYYRAAHTLYNEMAYYTTLPAMQARYRRRAAELEGRMVATLPADDDACFLSREAHFMDAADHRAAMAENTRWLRSVRPESHRYALVTLFRYLEYKAVNDTTNMMYWVAQSALADVRNGVMDLGSMWELANQLMLQGDVDRAYRYINYMTACSNVFGSRQRNWQITPLLSDIANKYRTASNRRTRQLWMALGLISVLAAGLLVMLFYSNRQRRHLAEARNGLRASNEELRQVNARMERVNVRLSEANRVKEEYIGRFLGQCTFYVDRMDELRKQVGRLLKKHDLDELAALARAGDYRQKEVEELYASFDDAFLHLFPNFVADFNALLRPECRVELPETGRLTTTVRIFALIRLGIDDSSKIAEFLNYSVNTIYNYRARVKNGALGDRDKFEEQVKRM